MGNNVGGSVDRSDLGLKPWYMLYEIEQNLNTGDIVLFSTRSTPGRLFRFHTNSKYCHVGIVVKIPKSDKSNYHSSESNESLLNQGKALSAEHVYILEPQVDYEQFLDLSSIVASNSIASKSSTSTNDLTKGSSMSSNYRVKVRASMLRLTSKLYSGYYDLVAVRKLKYLNGKKGSELIHTQLTDLLFDRDLERKDPQHDLANILESEFTFSIHPHYFNNFFRESLFENGLIFASPPEDRQLLISANFTALIYEKLGIFKMENMNIISKFTPFHFSEDSSYKLPFNKQLVMGLEDPMYIYLDYEVFADQLRVENKTLPLKVTDSPICDKIVRNRLSLNWNDSLISTLRSGDLIFTQEESTVGRAVRRVWNGSTYSRVGVIIRIQGQFFVYDIAPYYLSQDEAKIPNCKVLEGRVQSLHSYLASVPFIRVAVRKLESEGTNVSMRMQEKRVYVSLQLEPTNECLMNKRIRELFENIDGTFIPRVRFDVSNVFSCVFVLLMFKQLRLINVSDQPHDLLSYTPTHLLDFKKLNGDYKLGDEMILLNAEVLIHQHKV
ncbi:hypothetical protein FDP41_010606 [Naegleria fowleri]|uniref:Uncharacterized protein n=1 Tax=Naegleria fowleri TaxID=5763 RepID=A0A6A5C8R4_NAEFO|nr:uncharacterized protein FDP41_010606 [Naegleria fowleri]KAF0983541.1 hypothetical protein FDP41_010606 [Naegleria fowleri]CAG4708222.1 unnamed protein product [Naegleria fowleri]